MIVKREVFTLHFKNQPKELLGGRKNDGVVAILQLKPFHREVGRILCLEAKRLPTPGTGRKKEYVEGNLGGIERFKMGIHSRELPTAIMLGYIQKENAKHWHEQVNAWIGEQITASSNPGLTWAGQDKLTHAHTLGTVEKYYSRHARINSTSDTIEIYHYWLPLQ